MAQWYSALNYGIFNGMIINYAEYMTLRKAGIVFEIM